MRNERRGVSMVEVLIAVTIVAMAALPMLGLTGNDARHARLGEQHLAARMRARGLAESLAGLGQGTLAALGARGDLPAPAPAASWCKDRVTWQELEPGLGLLVVEVSFVLPGSPAGTGARSVKVERLVAQADRSLRGRHQLVRGEGGNGIS